FQLRPSPRCVITGASRLHLELRPWTGSAVPPPPHPAPRPHHAPAASAAHLRITRHMQQPTGLIAFWKNYDRKMYLEAAILADKLGYDSFWLPEVWGYEVFSLLTEIALNTKRIKLGTGIANVYSRSPALLAMQAATLQEISNGRLILGVGTSGKNVIEGLHGRPFSKPLSQTQDVIRVVKTLLSGGSLDQ